MFLPLGLTADGLEQLIDSQYGLRATHYARFYPGLRTEIATLDGQAIGYVMTEMKDDLRVIDFAVATPFRNQGIGTWVLNEVMARADQAMLPIRLMVEAYNPARRLYERHGFEIEADRGTDLELIRRC